MSIFCQSFETLVKSERDCFTLLTDVWFGVIVSIAACLGSDLVKTKRQSPDWNASRKRAENMRQVPNMDRVMYLLLEAIHKGGKDTTKVHSSVLIL